MKKNFIKISMIAVLSVLGACSVNESSGNKPYSSSSAGNYTSIDGLVGTYKNSYSGALTIHVQGKTDDMTISHTFAAGQGDYIILGVYQNYTNTVYVHDENSNIVDTLTYVTARIEHPTATVTKDELGNEGDSFNRDLYFMGKGSGGTVYGYDKKGELRYINSSILHLHRVFYSETGMYFAHKNGIFSINENKTSIDFYVANHHDSIPYNNGYLSAGYSDVGICDTVVELNSYGGLEKTNFVGDLFWDTVMDISGDITNITDTPSYNKLKQIIYDRHNPRGTQTDWAHINSLVYDEGVLYMSLRNQAVVAAKYPEWELLWWMADDTLKTLHGGVPNTNCHFMKVESLQEYRVQGAGTNDGPKNQHALFLHSDGDLAMFDNQGDEATSTTGSRYVRYKITEASGIWSAEKTDEYRDPNVYSRYMSDVDILANGNLLINYANANVLREVDLGTKTVKFEMKFNGLNSYRADKMPLYPYDDKTKSYSIDYNEKLGL